MNDVDKIEVWIDFGEEEPVGELILDNKNIYFKYYSSFIEKGLEISPFKMRLSDAILKADTRMFDGLFGVFDDSLPDGWGRLLLDRRLTSEGISLSQVTPLDRLSYLGSEGKGALIYKPNSEFSHHINQTIELDFLAEEMSQVLQGKSSEVIDELYQLGGSSGGARPKIFVGYNPMTDHLIHGTQELPAGYEHWIIKFPSFEDPKDIANIEFAYYKMALGAGIEMAPSKLFESKTGKNYFGTKRFDRLDEKKLHLHSASGIMHDNFRLSNLDYGHIMDCAFRLEKHVKAYEKVWRLAAFNVYAHNRDDHSRNFSFLMDENGKWCFAPAYDLTFSYSSHGHHSTTVAGESKNPKKENLMELAETFGLQKPNVILDQVITSVGKWKKIAIDSGANKSSITTIDKEINR